MQQEDGHLHVTANTGSQASKDVAEKQAAEKGYLRNILTPFGRAASEH